MIARAQPEAGLQAAPMREIAFTLPLLLPSLNVRDRQHWQARRRHQKRLQLEMIAAIGGPTHYPRPPFERARLTVVRFGRRLLDDDNLVGSAKSLLDLLKAWSPHNPLGLSLIVDDAPHRCELVAEQEIIRGGTTRTVVTIEELPYAAGRPLGTGHVGMAA